MIRSKTLCAGMELRERKRKRRESFFFLLKKIPRTRSFYDALSSFPRTRLRHGTRVSYRLCTPPTTRTTPVCLACSADSGTVRGKKKSQVKSDEYDRDTWHPHTFPTPPQQTVWLITQIVVRETPHVGTHRISHFFFFSIEYTRDCLHSKITKHTLFFIAFIRISTTQSSSSPTQIAVQHIIFISWHWSDDSVLHFFIDRDIDSGRICSCRQRFSSGTADFDHFLHIISFLFKPFVAIKKRTPVHFHLKHQNVRSAFYSILI